MTAIGGDEYPRRLGSVSVKNFVFSKGMPWHSDVFTARCLEVTLEEITRESLTLLLTIIVSCSNRLCHG